MKYGILSLFIIMVLVSCEDDPLIFEKSADERSAEAVANLKTDLTAPEFGWQVQYRPNNETGIYNVLLKFGEDGKVNIRTDLFANDGEFHDQTIPYRIDNSMGLELIFETYSFFSFLFELDQASFGGEFEFDFVNKTPDNALVFASKSDQTNPPSRLVLIPAGSDAENFLGRQLGENINTLLSVSTLFNPPLKLTFDELDLGLQLKIDDVSRTLTIDYLAPKSDFNNGEVIDFSTGFSLQNDQLVFEEPFSGSFNGIPFNITGITLNNLNASVLETCAGLNEDNYSFAGSVESMGSVTLENTLFDIKGKTVFERSDFFISQVVPTSFIFNASDSSAAPQIRADIDGVQDMQLYYFDDDLDPFFAIGFRVQNTDQTNTWLLKQYTPSFDGNTMIFSFADTISVFGNQDYNVNLESIDKYLDLLTEQDNTRIIEINENFYEFYNPCSGWRFIFSAT